MHNNNHFGPFFLKLNIAWETASDLSDNDDAMEDNGESDPDFELEGENHASVDETDFNEMYASHFG